MSQVHTTTSDGHIYASAFDEQTSRSWRPQVVHWWRASLGWSFSSRRTHMFGVLCGAGFAPLLPVLSLSLGRAPPRLLLFALQFAEGEQSNIVPRKNGRRNFMRTLNATRSAKKTCYKSARIRKFGSLLSNAWKCFLFTMTLGATQNLVSPRNLPQPILYVRPPKGIGVGWG